MANDWNLRGKARSDFHYIIRQLDNHVLAKAREQSEKAMKSKP